MPFPTRPRAIALLRDLHPGLPLLTGSALVVLLGLAVLSLAACQAAGSASALPPPTATVANNGPTATSTSLAPIVTPRATAIPPPTPTTVITAAVTTTDLKFDGGRAYQFVLDQVAIGPRPTGSEAGWKTGDYIIEQLKTLGWKVSTQEFVFKGVRGRNIIGKGGAGPIIILGAHYDTRPAAEKDPDPTQWGEPILGANDGASGVAVLLELARVLPRDSLKRQVWLTFFDAEDRGRLDDWPFSVGAMDLARRLTLRPEAVVVVDMIGDMDQHIYYEGFSHPELSAEIWDVAERLGYRDHFIPEIKHNIIDDHLPFVELGIPATDIIDFDYPYWHTIADTADKVSPDSLERVGRTLQVWVEEKR
jgi:glutaminyl-peptide cyclotransferase